MAKDVRSGATLSEALSMFRWVPYEHVVFVRIGEASGRLDLLLERIVARLDARSRMVKELAAKAAYPAFLYAFAVVVLPVPLILLGSAGTYLGILLLGLLPPALAALLVWKGRVLFPPGSPARSSMERALLRAPWLGRILADGSLGRALACLGILVQSGARLGESLDLAARATGWETLKAELSSIDSRIRSGRTFTEALRECRALRDLHGTIARIAAGEKAGRLDEALLGAGEDLEERAFARAIVAVRLVPFVLLPIVGGLVLTAAIRVFSGTYGGS